MRRILRRSKLAAAHQQAQALSGDTAFGPPLYRISVRRPLLRRRLVSRGTGGGGACGSRADCAMQRSSRSPRDAGAAGVAVAPCACPLVVVPSAVPSGPSPRSESASSRHHFLSVWTAALGNHLRLSSEEHEACSALCMAFAVQCSASVHLVKLCAVGSSLFLESESPRAPARPHAPRASDSEAPASCCDGSALARAWKPLTSGEGRVDSCACGIPPGATHVICSGRRAR